ncbi:hypothetical protein ABK040_014312 [Willaertia magna]
MKGFSFGILGTGRIAHDFTLAFQSMIKHHHSQINLSSQNQFSALITQCKIYGVASRNPLKSQQFAKEHDIPISFSSYESMLNDPNIDIIYVATPNSEHYTNVKLCLENNKSVLCEKTFTLNWNQANELFKIAKERNLFLMEANWMPFFPLFKETKYLIESGVIGKVKLIHAQLGFKNNHELNSGLIENSLGGGALLACGVYPISFVGLMMNDFSPESIQSVATFVKNNNCKDNNEIDNCKENNNAVDESVECQFKFSDNRLAHISTSIAAFIDSSATIHGTKGKIHLSDMCCCPTKLTLVKYENSSELDNSNYDNSENQQKEQEIIIEESPLYGNVDFNAFNFPNSEGLAYEIEHVIDCLYKQQIESTIVSSQVTLGTLKIMDQIRKEIGLKFNGEDNYSP